MKHRLSFIICLLVMIISIPVAYADNKECSFDSANFSVFLNSDGSADVTEEWTVNYKKGIFSRLYKNIFLGVPKEEEFEIGNWNVTVDGIYCDYTTDTNDRPDFHYGVIDKGKIVTYEVYAKSQEQIRTYKISYTLYDVVKHVDDEYYLFTYRFLPNNYKNNVKSLNVDIFAPNSDCTMKVLYHTSGSAEEQSDYGEVNIETRNAKDMFKVKVRIDGDVFSNSITELNSSELENRNISSILNYGIFLVLSLINIIVYTKLDYGINKKNILISLFIIFFALGITGILFGITELLIFIIILNIGIFIETLKRLRCKRIANKNPQKVQQIINKWAPYFKCQAQFVSYFGDNSYISFLIYLIDLFYNQVIGFSPDYDYIYYPIDINNDKYIDNYYHHILKILEDIRISNEVVVNGIHTDSERGFWKLSVYCIFEYINNKYSYENVDKTINDIKNTTLNIPNKSAFLKDVKLLSYVFSYTTPPISLNFENLCKNYRNITFLINFVMHINKYKPKNVKPTPFDDNEDKFDLLDAMLDVCEQNKDLIHSSYSGSSCSSCSSCGGCGGCGGAD